MNTYLTKLCVGISIGVCALIPRQANAAEVAISVVKPGRLKTMERKARQTDQYKAHAIELQKTLDDMLSLLQPNMPIKDARSGVGQLSKLLKKARRADVLGREVDEVRDELDSVVGQRDALKDQVSELKSERDTGAKEVKRFKAEIETLHDKVGNLRETVNRLLLGEFEYYEVKQGDSLQSIAANPLIYGDPSRATWLRQVNEGRVKHLEHLRPGEMLVIPRFPRNGSYEF